MFDSPSPSGRFTWASRNAFVLNPKHLGVRASSVLKHLAHLFKPRPYSLTRGHIVNSIQSWGFFGISVMYWCVWVPDCTTAVPFCPTLFSWGLFFERVVMRVCMVNKRSYPVVPNLRLTLRKNSAAVSWLLRRIHQQQ